MKTFLMVGLMAAAGTLLSLAPAESANLRSHTKYCMGATYDPICMRKNMRPVRNDNTIYRNTTPNHSRYCEGASADTSCNDTTGF